MEHFTRKASNNLPWFEGVSDAKNGSEVGNGRSGKIGIDLAQHEHYIPNRIGRQAALQGIAPV